MTDFNEKQLEQMLCEHLPETALAGTLTDINPFREAVSKVIAGLVLTTFTLQFLYLNYMLPTIGVMLIYLGMRTLRSGNGYFRGGWLLSLLRVILVSFQMLVIVTPYSAILGDWALWLGQGIHLGFLFCLGMGIRKAGLQAGLEHPKMATWPVMLWQILFLGIAMVGSSSWTILILMVASWVNLVRRICRCADDLKTVGYGVPASPVWFSAKPMLLTYLLFLVVTMTGLSLMANYTPVDGKKVDASTFTGASESASAVRRDLIGKGFPEEMLSQILDEDLENLGEVTAISVKHEQYGTDSEGRMAGSAAAVQTADGRIRWFVTYGYKEGKHPGIVEGVKIQNDSEQKWEAPVGRIFWEKKGQMYMAELDMDLDTSTHLWFGAVSKDSYCSSRYSFPPLCDGTRGYFTYWTEDEAFDVTGWGLCSTNVYAQRKILVLPYEDLPVKPQGDLILFGGFGDGFGEERMQIYSTAEFSEISTTP